MGNDSGSAPSATTDHGGSVPLETIPLHSASLLTVVDESGTIQYESPSVKRVLGFDPETLLKGQVDDYVHPNDYERVMKTFATVVSDTEDDVKSVEYRHEQADGTYRWVESVASTTPMSDGRYVVNTRDISKRKERERELERTNERLEEFASTVSHDLRNPLSIAKLQVGRALEAGDCGHLEEAVQAHGRMESLIETLLELARAGKQIDETEPIDLERLGALCWQSVDTGEAALLTEADRPIHADRTRTRQLLENLVRNATEHGGDSVTVTIGEFGDGETAGFYVEDDGAGIPEPEREKVLESGYSTQEDGTGFGLAIVSDVAEAHDWDVAVTESDAGGARIEFTGVERR